MFHLQEYLMKVKNSISTTMTTLKGKETKDKAAKNIFSYKPIMGNIIKMKASVSLTFRSMLQKQTLWKLL